MEEELLNHLKGLKKEDGTPLYDFEKDATILSAVTKHKESKTLESTEKEKLAKELSELKAKLGTQSEKKEETPKPSKPANGSDETEKVATKSKVAKEEEKGVYLTLNDLEKLLDERLSPVLESVKSLTTESVAEYKRRIIKENDGAIIPEMILGATKKDIDASLIAAKAAHAKYVGLPNKKAEKSEKEDVKTPPKSEPAKIPAIPMGGGNSGGNEIDAATIAKMSIKEFAEHRDKLKAFARLSK